MTQEDLAHDADLTTAALARIELGKSNPTWATVRRIVAAMDVSLVELARRVDRA